MVAAQRIGVVVIDMWNGYPCCTGRGLFAALVPRMNRALAGMRALGATIIHAPSDVSDQYVGWPQAERVAALPRYELPEVRSIATPRFPFAGQTCLCGPGIVCPYLHHWHAIHPDLALEEQDYLLVGPVYGSAGTQRLHALCRQRDLTHLLYLGIATNNCVVSKAAGMLYLARAGLEVILARDLTAAYDHYDPARGYTNDAATARAVAALEQQFCPTVNLGAELAKTGRWPVAPPVDAVHLMPWGAARSALPVRGPVRGHPHLPCRPSRRTAPRDLDPLHPGRRRPLPGDPALPQAADDTRLRDPARAAVRRRSCPGHGECEPLLPSGRPASAARGAPH